MNAITADSPTRFAPRPALAGKLAAVASWPLAGIAAAVFLPSLPYKFAGHPDTVHIFSTIGAWMSTGLGAGVGDAFARYGAYAVGTLELLTVLVLLAPVALWAFARARGQRVGPDRARWHAAGGAMAAALMAGGAFFHLASPLGTTVINAGMSDGGSLFRAALTVLVAGLVLLAMNLRAALKRQARAPKRSPRR